jgi:large subunit ribosomal protein L5
MVATAKKYPRLHELYREKVAAEVMKEFGIDNPNDLPRLAKIVVSVGVGKQLENQKLKPEYRDTVISTLTTITGQKPIMIVARKAVSNFRVREGAPSSFMVTMRRDRMWFFLDRLINLAIPRIKDFRGLKERSFDKGGSYSFGLTEQAVWPEINMANFNHSHGMHVTLCFEKSDPKKSRFLLEKLGFPFTRPDADGRRR